MSPSYRLLIPKRREPSLCMSSASPRFSQEVTSFCIYIAVYLLNFFSVDKGGNFCSTCPTETERRQRPHETIHTYISPRLQEVQGSLL